jgi:hypothetical protein
MTMGQEVRRARSRSWLERLADEKAKQDVRGPAVDPWQNFLEDALSRPPVNAVRTAAGRLPTLP